MIISNDAPISEYMSNDMSEEDISRIHTIYTEALASDDCKQYLREADIGSIVALGTVGVAAIIGLIFSYVKNHYRMNVKKIYDHSKELNDIYVKVEALIKTDKMARFRHRNDRINIDIEYGVLVDLKDVTKTYNLTPDIIQYDPEYPIAKINAMMDNVNAVPPANRKEVITATTEAIIKELNDHFDANHWFIIGTKPMMKVSSYKGIKLEQCLQYCKNTIGSIYNCMYYYNKYIDVQLKYIQMMQQSYNSMIAKYGKDKDAKEAVDKIFTLMLQNMSKVIDFNNAIIEIYDHMIQYYVVELNKIYDIIRS